MCHDLLEKERKLSRAKLLQMCHDLLEKERKLSQAKLLQMCHDLLEKERKLSQARSRFVIAFSILHNLLRIIFKGLRLDVIFSNIFFPLSFKKWFLRNIKLKYCISSGIGFVLVACSVFVAGSVEIYRKRQLGFEQKVGDDVIVAANVSVFLQIPQFFLVGAGEAFASISGIILISLNKRKQFYSCSLNS